ncbi:hypothetical protein PpBr36_04226 [Pyricularia pennisetigena]|uniref:hypothetical protein n=1 Tax=Pyricularia pennisetigena TaxID=1578925 RepID=UPI00114F23E6|nr:hypothetical protein PpBr36_04226 [Pyricularia pennisetigena]TLS27531.1 hypothetical protein PpBr36_04226 [Pyricularia pennisetigena]
MAPRFKNAEAQLAGTARHGGLDAQGHHRPAPAGPGREQPTGTAHRSNVPNHPGGRAHHRADDAIRRTVHHHHQKLKDTKCSQTGRGRSSSLKQTMNLLSTRLTSNLARHQSGPNSREKSKI